GPRRCERCWGWTSPTSASSTSSAAQHRQVREPPPPTTPRKESTMSGLVEAHKDLHSEQGPRKGEHPGRSPNPVIKVHDVAWLEFEKPNLDRAETFAH